MLRNTRVIQHWRLSTFVVYRRFQDLMVDIFGTKRDIDNQKTALDT